MMIKTVNSCLLIQNFFLRLLFMNIYIVFVVLSESDTEPVPQKGGKRDTIVYANKKDAIEAFKNLLRDKVGVSID